MRLLTLAAALAWGTPAAAQTVADWRPYVVEASERFGVPIAWIEAVMRAESRGRTHLNGRPIRSSAGAMGLMQLMPATWAEMRSRLGLGRNPDEPHDNILAGTFYLRLLYDRFGYPGLFGAYNAGPARYAEHMTGRRSLPSETVGYLATVAPRARQAPAQQVAIDVPVEPTRAPVGAMLIIRKEPPVEVASRAEAAVPSSLFVALSRDK